jgi:hypothetical protein
MQHNIADDSFIWASARRAPANSRFSILILPGRSLPATGLNRSSGKYFMFHFIAHAQ